MPKRGNEKGKKRLGGKNKKAIVLKSHVIRYRDCYLGMTS